MSSVERTSRFFFVSLLLAWALPAHALGPFEKNHPVVGEGMAAYEKGDFETALRKFDEAKKELPRSAAVEFNRGNALYKLGRFEDAREAYRRVADLDQTDLRQRDYYNLGNTWAASGDEKEAVAAYRKALTLDPRDQLARHNLEVVLRKLPPPKQDPSPDGGTPDAGPPDGGRSDAGRPDAGPDGGLRDGGQDAGMDGGRPDGGDRGDAGQDGGADAGQGDGGQDGGGSPKPGGDGGQDGGGDGGQQGEGDKKGDGGQKDDQQSPGEDGGGPRDGGADGGALTEEAGRDGGTSSQAEMDKQQAEKLLDSMKNNEKNLQLWRFQQKKQRKQNDKDW